MKRKKNCLLNTDGKTSLTSRTRAPVLWVPKVKVMGFFLLCCLVEFTVLTRVSTAEIHGSTGGGAIAGTCHVTVVEAESEDSIEGASVMIG